MNKGLMLVVGKLDVRQRVLYAECKERLQAKTDAEAKACAEATRAGKYLDELPGKLKRRAKGNPDQGSLISDESRQTRIHAIREERLKRWQLMS